MKDNSDGASFVSTVGEGSATDDGATVTTVQPIPDPIFDALPWYRWWVIQQLRSQPQRPFLCLPNSDWDDKSGLDSFLRVWSHTRELVLSPSPKTVDSIASALIDLGVLLVQENYNAAQSAKDLVFSILGWQTMLYKPDFLSADAMAVYKLYDEMDGYEGEARACLIQSPYAGKKPLPDFLLGFGMMLPPPNHRAFADEGDQQYFGECKTISRKEMNAHVLKNICGLRFQWVDSLSCHLEMDKRSGTIFLYRYPSFCLYHLKQQTHDREHGKMMQGQKCVLHCCAFESRSAVPWADREDVTKLLQQVLLSYRLLFGQGRRSREVFRNLRPFARIDAEGQDRFLSELCSKRWLVECPVELEERDEYDLAEDFPHLRSKLVRLSRFASSKKPQSLRQLWADRRNSPAWLAFWSVLIFGSMGIFLAVIQTVFAILQYAEAIRHPND